MILTAVSMVAGLLSGLLVGGVGLLFVLATAYCGWEVRWTNRWSVVIAAPLVLFVTLFVVELVTGSGGGLRGLVSGLLLILVASGPMLVAAEAAAGTTLGWRAWRLRSNRA